MHRSIIPSSIRRALLALGAASLIAAPFQAFAEWSSEEAEGAVTAKHGDTQQLTWQMDPLGHPSGSDAFLPSAFLHPLRTPAGFEWTQAFPGDHIHHLGVWWPWKHIVVDGETYNCWELQHGQGAHHAVSAKEITSGPDAVEWEFRNEIRIRKPDGGPPVTDGITAVHEKIHMRIARHDDEANAIDIIIHQAAADKPVTIGQYRYSGFSWRGPASWDKSNSVMTTSENLDRDKANGTKARWVLLTGPADGDATASVLMMSAAAEIAETPELLRVWDSGAHNGTPFVNFNPVQDKSLPLDAETPAVSHREYRLIAADRTLTVEEAEAEWKAWREAANN